MNPTEGDRKSAEKSQDLKKSETIRSIVLFTSELLKKCAAARRGGGIAPRPHCALAAFYFLPVDCIRRFAFAVGFVVTSKPRGPEGA